MNVSEKIIHLRKTNGMSQEELAEKLDISRQAVSRWENGIALPDARNILALSRLFGVTADYLLNDDCKSDDDLPKVKENKEILHTNLTRIAIIVQGACLNTFAQGRAGAGVDRRRELLFRLVPLFLASVWMASNHRYEKNIAQRAKNTKIETVYCVCQAAIAASGYFFDPGIWAAPAIIAVLLVYILVINPRYMNRRLVRERKK